MANYQNYMEDVLDSLTLSDISMIKSFKNPPDSVLLVLQALCVILRLHTDNGKASWSLCRKMISDASFLNCLINYDKDNMPNSLMDKIRTEFISNPNFNPEKVKASCAACEGLCKWVLGLEMYDKIKRNQSK